MKRLIAIAIAILLLATMLPLSAVSADHEDRDHRSWGVSCEFYSRERAYSSTFSERNDIFAYAFVRKTSWGYGLDVYSYTELKVYRDLGNGQYEYVETLSAKDTNPYDEQGVWDQGTYDYPIKVDIYVKHYGLRGWYPGRHCEYWIGYLWCGGGEVTFSAFTHSQC